LHIGSALCCALIICALAASWPARAELSSDDYANPVVIVPRSAPAIHPAPAPPPPPEPEPAETEQTDLRPLPVRLTEQRCASCHSAAQYAQTGRTRLSWELAVLRMQVMNGAQVPFAERQLIVSHLAGTYPASTARAFVEWLELAAAIAGGFAFYFLTRRVSANG
jgi:hypothetical protein